MRASVIGFDLGATSLKAGFVSRKQGVLRQEEVPLGAKFKSEPNNVLKLMAEIAERLAFKRQVEAISVVTAGSVDVSSRTIYRTSNFPGWESVRVGAQLHRLIGKPVFMDNDANGFARAAWRYDLLADVDHMIGITLGTGVGGGIILNRKLWYGDTGSAGEIGHFVLRERGRTCGCGGRGCFERYAAASAKASIARKFARQFPRSPLHREDNIDGYTISKHAKDGDPYARQILYEYGRLVGLGFASLVASIGILNFVIGGKGALDFPIYRKALVDSLLEQTPYLDIRRKLRIQATELGDRAGILGAASMVFENN